MFYLPLFSCVTLESYLTFPNIHFFICVVGFLKIKVKRDQLNRLMHEKMFNTVPGVYGQCSRNCNCYEVVIVQFYVQL